MRVLHGERRSALVDSICSELGPVVEVLGGEAGMHLVVALPDGRRDVEIPERAAGHNLWIWPLSRSYIGEMSRSGFILGFGSATVAEIPRAVRKLREMRPTCSPFSIFTRVLKLGNPRAAAPEDRREDGAAAFPQPTPPSPLGPPPYQSP